jgi:hypothetical protein
MSFASSLLGIVNDKKAQQHERKAIAEKWTSYESTLIDEAVKLFKQRCKREAVQRKLALTASFEVLSRDIKGFPTHVVKDSTYMVKEWPEGVTAEAWFYAVHGCGAHWSSGDRGVLFAEMLEDMMPKFLERLQTLGFRVSMREVGTWKVSVAWASPTGDEDMEPANFADELTAIVAEQQLKDKRNIDLGKLWLDYEAKLLGQAFDVFKQRCIREAEQQRCEATVSFEVLSREIPDFPKRVCKDSNFFVSSWGGGCTTESWFYATHGGSAVFNDETPALFAEVLECMMPKFLTRLQALGFKTCGREAGTWKVRVTWPDPDEGGSKKRKLNGID